VGLDPAASVIVPDTVVVPATDRVAEEVNVPVPTTLSGPVSVSGELWVRILPELTVTPAMVSATFTVTVLLIVTVSAGCGATPPQLFHVPAAFQLPVTFDVHAFAASASPLQTPSSDTHKMILKILFIMHLRDNGIK
jgi:hypothetical protein